MFPMWIARHVLPALPLAVLAVFAHGAAGADSAYAAPPVLDVADSALVLPVQSPGDGPVLAPTGAAATAGPVSYASPSALVLHEMNERHRSGHWLIVSTTDGPIRLRADHFSPRGVEGIRMGRKPPPFPVLEWSKISKVERRASGFRAGQLTIGTISSLFPPYVLTALGGAWLGGRLGDRIVRTTTLYEATPAASEPHHGLATAALDSVQGRIGLDPLDEGTIVAGGVVPDLELIRRGIPPGSQVQVWTRFGNIKGTVGAIDSMGLRGIRPPVRWRGRLDQAQPVGVTQSGIPDPIAWSDISGVYRRGHSGGRGAAYGAVLLGGGTGALAAWIGNAFGANGKETTGAFFAGAAAGGLVGAGLGYLVGSAFKDWRPVPGFHVPAMPEASTAEAAPTSDVGDQAREP